MTPIKVPELLKPDTTITYGFSGGAALYVETWNSVETLFEFTNVPQLAWNTILLTPLN